MEKAADAFRTISEVADDLSLPQHVLRFWETRFPQIRPLKRAGGRRYYRPADVTLLRRIRQLLYDDGYTIKGVQRLLKEQGVKGLGAGAPPVADPEESEPTAAALDFDGIQVSTGSTLEDAESQAIEPSAVALVGPDRAVIEDAIAIVEGCRRLLADALKGQG